VQSGKLSSNPCHGVETSPEARTDDPTTVLSLDEIRTLLSYRKLPEKQRTAYTVAIYSGLREGELWGLRWEDVHLEGADPHVAVRYGVRGKPTKGGRPRIVPLLPPALSALRAWRSRGGVDRRFGYVFVGPSGLPHATGYDAGWADVRKRRKKRVVVTPGWKTRAGIARGVRFHDLRHTCGAHLVMGSWGKAWRLEELQVLLGHASRTTTERYAKYLPGNLHSVAAESRAQWVGFGHHSGTGPSPPKR
jgi:integrase